MSKSAFCMAFSVIWFILAAVLTLFGEEARAPTCFATCTILIAVGYPRRC